MKAINPILLCIGSEFASNAILLCPSSFHATTSTTTTSPSTARIVSLESATSSAAMPSSVGLPRSRIFLVLLRCFPCRRGQLGLVKHLILMLSFQLAQNRRITVKHTLPSQTPPIAQLRLLFHCPPVFTLPR